VGVYTLIGWWRLLTVILRDLAADIGGSDPTTRVRSPESAEAARRESRVLTEPDLLRFLESVRLCAPHRYVEFLTMALNGARAGEVYALKWDSVDFERGEIIIQRGISGGILSDST
jgi:integrase